MISDRDLTIELECARQMSEDMGTTVYAMSNGHRIRYTDRVSFKETLEKAGFWTMCIFEKGWQVEI